MVHGSNVNLLTDFRIDDKIPSRFHDFSLLLTVKY